MLNISNFFAMKFSIFTSQVETNICILHGLVFEMKALHMNRVCMISQKAVPLGPSYRLKDSGVRGLGFDTNLCPVCPWATNLFVLAAIANNQFDKQKEFYIAIKRRFRLPKMTMWNIN